MVEERQQPVKRCVLAEICCSSDGESTAAFGYSRPSAITRIYPSDSCNRKEEVEEGSRYSRLIQPERETISTRMRLTSIARARHPCVFYLFGGSGVGGDLYIFLDDHQLSFFDVYV